MPILHLGDKGNTPIVKSGLTIPRIFFQRNVITSYEMPKENSHN